MTVRLIPYSCIIALTLGLSTADLQADSNSLGYKTYQMQCADCHGKKAARQSSVNLASAHGHDCPSESKGEFPFRSMDDNRHLQRLLSME